MSRAYSGSSARSTHHDGMKGSKVVITRLEPGRLLITPIGRDEGDLIGVELQAIEDEIRKAGLVSVFVDARELRGQATRVRETAEAWLRIHKPSLRSVHILVRSRLLDMAISLVNLAFRGIVNTYSSVDSFERAIAHEVPGFTHLPSLALAPTGTTR